ncbi:MAG: hypothetical protein QXY76_02565 [Nitrososphaeria archaeon]
MTDLGSGRKTYPLSLILVFVATIFLAITKYLENDPIFVIFSWFSTSIGFYMITAFLEGKGIFLSQKIILPIILIVTLGGGIVANAYIFANCNILFVKMFSLSILLLIALVYSFGIIAYFMGKRELARKILNWILNK